MLIMGLGLGLVFVAVQIAGNAGVPADKAGLAGALINASFQLGGALGLAILSALATTRSHQLLSEHATLPRALVGGYARALLGATFFVAAVALTGMRAANTKGEPTGSTEITGVAIPDTTAHAAVNGSRPPPATERRRRSDEGLADVKDSQERADLPGYTADVGHRVAGSPDSRGGWRTTESAPAPASTPTSPPTASPGNDLTDHLLLDELSGTSAMNGVPVTVEAAQPIPAPS